MIPRLKRLRDGYFGVISHIALYEINSMLDELQSKKPRIIRIPKDIMMCVMKKLSLGSRINLWKVLGDEYSSVFEELCFEKYHEWIYPMGYAKRVVIMQADALDMLFR